MERVTKFLYLFLHAASTQDSIIYLKYINLSNHIVLGHFILILLVSFSYHVTPIWFKVGFLSDFSRQFVMVLYRGNQNNCLTNRTIFHGLVTCRLGWLVGYVPHVIQLFSSTWPTLTDAAVCRYVYFLLLWSNVLFMSWFSVGAWCPTSKV